MQHHVQNAPALVGTIREVTGALAIVYGTTMIANLKVTNLIFNTT